MYMTYEIQLNIIEKVFETVEAKAVFNMDELVVKTEKITKQDRKIFEKYEPEIWKKIKSGFYQIYIEGENKIDENISNVKLALYNAKKDLGESYDKITLNLQSKINELKGELYKAAFKIFPSKLELYGTTFNASNVKVGYELNFSGSIEASITNLFKFAAQGKIILEINYKM